jgi:hypothetical protein
VDRSFSGDRERDGVVQAYDIVATEVSLEANQQEPVLPIEFDIEYRNLF